MLLIFVKSFNQSLFEIDIFMYWKCSVSGNVLAMSDFAGDIDAELGGPLLLSAVHLDMPDYTDVSRCRIAWISVSRGPGRSPWGPGV